MGVHDAAGNHVAVDWRLSRAVPALYRKAGDCRGESREAGVSDSGPADLDRDPERAADKKHKCPNSDSTGSEVRSKFIHPAIQSGGGQGQLSEIVQNGFAQCAKATSA